MGADVEGDAAVRSRRAFQYENPRADVQALVPRAARRILDLGCSSGALGAALKARQECEVVGVELDPEYGRSAEGRLDAVVVGDLERLVADGALAELGDFDCVIAADVLEHLRDPWQVMRTAAGRLRAGGSAVVSVPNVRFWETFWQVGYRATWPLQDHGIFDRTHLRWFTLWDARWLLEQAGFDVGEVSPQYRLRPEPSRFDRRLRVLDRTKHLGSFFTFQYVMRGELRAGGAGG
jgi:2-polyprenyl-3-methyl-5-hydroxy-6-metoxy-1,4-benzoquinol methylase